MELTKNMTEPSFVPPMLARLVRTLPEGPEWEYELKLDGYRLEAIKNGDKLRLYSRRGNDFTKKFTGIAASVSKIKATSFVLDGEAVAVNEQGKPSFQMLQNHIRPVLRSRPLFWSLRKWLRCHQVWWVTVFACGAPSMWTNWRTTLVIGEGATGLGS